MRLKDKKDFGGGFLPTAEERMRLSFLYSAMKFCAVVILFLISSVTLAQPPRIDSMRIDESKGELSIFGDFGISQGKVWCDSVELAVVSWSNTVIVATIPNTGRGSAGEVLVDRNGNRSKLAFLTRWTCSFIRDAELNTTNRYDFENVSLTISTRLDIQSVIKNHTIPSKLGFTSSKSILYDTSTDIYSANTDISNSQDTVQCIGEISLSDFILNFNVSFGPEIQLPNDRPRIFEARLDSNLFVQDTEFKIYYQTSRVKYIIHGNVQYLPSPSILRLLSVPNLKYPGNLSINIPTMAEFKWDSLSDINQYRFQIFSDSLKSILVDTIVELRAIQLLLKSKHHYYWRVCSVNESGEGRWSETWEFTTGDPSSVGLFNNKKLQVSVYPNPAKDIIHISYSNPNGLTKLAAYDLRGNLIRQFQNSSADISDWDVSTLPSGSYVIGLSSGSESCSAIVSIVK